MNLKFKIQKRNIIAITIFLSFYIIFGIVVTLIQERIVYQPSAQNFNECKAFEEAEKVTYNGTRMYYKKNNNDLVILYHGNGGSACGRAFLANIIESTGQSYLIVEYAGYSNDPKETTHELVKNDVKNVVEYTEKLRHQKTIVTGESLGSGPASLHSTISEVDKLLLISPYASLADIARRRFWFYPTFLMAENAFDNIELLRDYSGSILILHGNNDLIISIKSAKKLFENLKTENKKFVELNGVGHNNIATNELFYTEINNFLKTE